MSKSRGTNLRSLLDQWTLQTPLDSLQASQKLQTVKCLQEMQTNGFGQLMTKKIFGSQL